MRSPSSSTTIRATSYKAEADELAAEIAKDPQIVHREAEKAAKARGKNALLPREIRGMSLSERTRAHEFMFDAILGVEQAPRTAADGSRQVARALGMLSGRGGTDRPLTGVMLSEAEWHVDLGKLAAAVDIAPAEQLAIARRGAEAAFLWLPALLPLLLAEATVADAAAFRVMQTMAARLQPELYVTTIAHSLAGPVQQLQTKNVIEVQKEPDIALDAARWILDRPNPRQDYRVVVRQLRPYQREKLKFAVVAYENDRRLAAIHGGQVP